MLACLALMMVPSQRAFAEVTFAADGTVGGTTFTDAQIAGTFEGGGSTGAIVVGISEFLAGGLFIDGTAPFPAPLVSSSGVVGQDSGSFGAVDLSDLASLWNVTGTLAVGSAGKGSIDISNAAAVRAATAVIGDLGTGNGTVKLNGLGSRFLADVLTVGAQGHGEIEATNDSLIYTTAAASIGATDVTGDGRISLTGSGTSWSAASTLDIGGAVGASHGVLHLADLAVAQVEGALTVNPQGIVDLAGGTLRMLPQAGNLITNNGLIRGDGFIDGGITIGAAGKLRNAYAQVQNGSTVTRQREYLLVAEAVVNGGTIQSLGGAMEFEGAVTNDFEIIARDAEMHFRAGVFNETGGVVSIGGDTTLHGDLVNNGGSLFVLSGSESLLIGDLTFTGSSVLGLTAGPAAGTLDVTGMADLAGALLTLDYSAGVTPTNGDTYQIFQAAGGIMNFPGTPMVPVPVSDGIRLWDVAQVGFDTLIATFNGALANPMGSDFNGDGVVDQLDIAIWQNNFPIAGGAGKTQGDSDNDGDVDGADFLKIQLEFGLPPTFPIAAVPEPSTLVLALLTLVGCPRRRRLS